MDQCASALLSFPPDGNVDEVAYDKAARAHVQRLSQLLKEKSSLLNRSANDLLEHLDPARNSISYLVLLQTILDTLSQASSLPEGLLEHIVTFLLTFEPRQIRYAGSPFSGLLTRLRSSGAFPATVAVNVLASALLRLDPSGSMFTSHHLPLVKLAYETNNVEPVLKVINSKIAFYPIARSRNESRPICSSQLPPTSYITPESGLTDVATSAIVLEYDFLCGQCHLFRRDWQSAFDAFQRVVTFPTKDHGCSNIQVEAYKKWILVSLLLKGKGSSLPPSAGQGVQKSYTMFSTSYLSIVSAFEKPNGGAQALKAEVEGSAQQPWPEDGNLGLLREVIAHYQQWQIIRLRDVYSKISLEEVRKSTQSAETGKELARASDVEALVQAMIDSGMLSGVIEKPGGAQPGDGRGYLAFLPSAEELSEEHFAAEILASVRNIKNLEPIVQATNERLATSRDYIRQLVKDQKRERDNAKDAAIGFDAQVEEEDLMTDLLTGH